jgi:hypothetical protein
LQSPYKQLSGMLIFSKVLIERRDTVLFCSGESIFVVILLMLGYFLIVHLFLLWKLLCIFYEIISFQFFE